MKDLLNLGKALNKAEQKQVLGGERHYLTKADAGCHEYSEHVTPCPTVAETSPIYEGGCWVIASNC
ncbi:hypothetical protein [Winogradskyella flava]|uniref:hypothetical protein n=1 Tax=Winogradskyella flava TaxID=1884876 RepID=UPI00249297D8|nr:hypothetical protein [Winogradskyella flava]